MTIPTHTHQIRNTHDHSHSFTAPDIPWKQHYGNISISDEMARDFLARDRREAEADMSKMIDEVMRKHYLPALNEQLYRPSAIAAIMEAQEKNMDTKCLVNDEVERRKAKKAKAKVKKAYKAFDALELDGNDYAVWAWSHTFKGKDTVFEYVALYTNERWYVTGAKSPNGLDTDEFVGWLVGMEFDPDTFACLA